MAERKSRAGSFDMTTKPIKEKPPSVYQKVLKRLSRMKIVYCKKTEEK